MRGRFEAAARDWRKTKLEAILASKGKESILGRCCSAVAVTLVVEGGERGLGRTRHTTHQSRVTNWKLTLQVT
jgi:hypothetical protein